MFYDTSGNLLISIGVTLLLGAAIGASAGGISAAATGQDVFAGMAGGAISGLISTAGMALAVTTGGIGGLIIAGTLGFVAGAGSNAVQQGISKGWDNISYEDTAKAGVGSALFSAISFGRMNFAMRESVGLFDDVFDISRPFISRFGSALGISPGAVLATGMFGLPVTIGQTIYDIGVYYSKKNLEKRNRIFNKKICMSLK